MNEEWEEKLELYRQLFHEKSFARLKELLSELNPADIAELFEEMTAEEAAVVFRLLPKELAADSFAYFEYDIQEALITAFSDKELKDIVDVMYIDDAVDMIEEMPANVVKRILAQAKPETRMRINEILKYPEDSAGSLMTIEYVSLKKSMTVSEAFERIRKTGTKKETVYTCYVTDANRHLEGFVSVKDLLIASPDDLIEDIMETNVICAETGDDQEMVAQMMGKYDFIALPVVDAEHRLVGIVTVDDALDVLEEETTEDIEKMAAISPSDKPYLKTSPFELWLHRIPWLLLLMISATFTGMIISGFEDKLAVMVVLTSFIPMIMDTGGNSGGQASVTIIRGLSLGEIEMSDLPQVIWKEVRVAVLCGLSLSLVCFGKIMLVDRMLLGNTDVTVYVGLVVCITLFITILLAKSIGALLPILAKSIGFDPAVMASPFITTIVDALALMVYFKAATLILHI